MLKSLVAKIDLDKGHKLSYADINLKSPGGGLPPYELDNVIGKTLNCSLKEDDAITSDKLN